MQESSHSSRPQTKEVSLQSSADTKELLELILQEIHIIKESQQEQSKELHAMHETLDLIDRILFEHFYGGPLYAEDPNREGKLVPYTPKPDINQASGV